jgi:hypothetical protein
MSDPKNGQKGVEAIECVLRNNMECALICILKTSSFWRKKMKSYIDLVNV